LPPSAANATAYSLRFGANIDPNAADPEEAVSRAQVAEDAGYDLALVQDHPDNPEHLDTWTVLGAIATSTNRIIIGSNVSPLPLRPPVMLAKAVASLQVLTHGRVILGLGAGGFLEQIAAFGAPARSPGESVTALDEGIQLIRQLWSNNQAISFSGDFYQTSDAVFGPKPEPAIPIWIGGSKPRMLRLTGRLGDGILLSAPRVPLDDLPGINATINEAALDAGREPGEVRRAYNVMGDIVDSGGDDAPAGGGGYTVDAWIRDLTTYARCGRIDTFIFWPNHDRHAQLRRFAAEVVPGVRAALADSA
jgi:alkanesulfonate monooxygenase SsuD/methylene tetrahydromethanopterin reductase-like flavin-dependent oxidoreductase (luciferase family)